MGVFTQDPLVTDYTLKYFRIVPLGYAFFAIAFIEANVFQGIGRSWPGFWITLSRVLIAVGISAVATSVFELPISWVWISIVIGSVIASLGGLARTWRALRNSKSSDAIDEDIVDAEEVFPQPVG